jgi:hypothetical protein
VTAVTAVNTAAISFVQYEANIEKHVNTVCKNYGKNDDIYAQTGLSKLEGELNFMDIVRTAKLYILFFKKVIY